MFILTSLIELLSFLLFDDLLSLCCLICFDTAYDKAKINNITATAALINAHDFLPLTLVGSMIVKLVITEV